MRFLGLHGGQNIKNDRLLCDQPVLGVLMVSPYYFYTQTLILVHLILVKLFCVSIITLHHATITTCHFDRIIPLSFSYLYVPGPVIQAVDPRA